MKRYLPAFLWVAAAALVIFLFVINAKGAAREPVAVDKPRFSEMTVLAAYNEKGELIHCIVRATFAVTTFNADGLTTTTTMVKIPDFCLVQEKHQAVINGKNVQTTFGDLADDVLAALELKLKQAYPGPLPVTRRALREPPSK